MFYFETRSCVTLDSTNLVGAGGGGEGLAVAVAVAAAGLPKEIV